MSPQEAAALADQHRPLAPALARRMIPLALLVSLLVGALLPWSAQGLLVGVRQREAQLWASQLAGRLERAAKQRPQLWAYDDRLLAQVSAPLTEAPLRGAFCLDLPTQTQAWCAGERAREGAVQAWALVLLDERAVGRVMVQLDAAGARQLAGQLWVALGILAGILALLLLLFPLRAVRRGDHLNSQLYGALVQANAQLERRVAQRTAQLEQRTQELEQRRHQLQALGNRLVMVQEETRKQLSRDLHDDLGQVLTGLRLQLTAAQETLGKAQRPDHRERAMAQLEAATRSVDAGVERVRLLARALRSPSLEGLGTRDALQEHAEQFCAQAGLQLTLSVDAVEPPEDVGAVLFRIGQEALTNVARHAQASAVRLSLGPADDGWRLVVEDNGQGLPPGREGAGLGLVGASERVAQAGGYLDLEPAEGGGLRLTAWVP